MQAPFKFADMCLHYLITLSSCHLSATYLTGCFASNVCADDRLIDLHWPLTKNVLQLPSLAQVAQILLQQASCRPSAVGQQAPVMFAAAQAGNLAHSVPGLIFTSWTTSQHGRNMTVIYSTGLRYLRWTWYVQWWEMMNYIIKISQNIMKHPRMKEFGGKE